MSPATRFEPSSIKNKIKREEISRKSKKAKGQQKLQKRLAQAKVEANDPAAKKKRLAENVPRTLDNTREFDPSFLTADPGESSSTAQEETAQDIASDPFASYFSSTDDPSIPPKILITTSPKATKATFDFCDELVGVFPGAEFIRRKKGKGFEVGRIAGWAAGRGYKHMCVVNEDSKKPNAITLVHLPNGPTAYFKLTSVQLTKDIYGHARATPHDPRTCPQQLRHTSRTRLVTLHNQRDFLFFRRHRYAFRSTEKVALQEIGPRFTLKLRSLRKGIPAVQRFGDPAKPLEFDVENKEEDEGMLEEDGDAAPQTKDTEASSAPQPVVPPETDEYLWEWKPDLETTRRTFFFCSLSSNTTGNTTEYRAIGQPEGPSTR
ncbi:Brix domain-containing protein [Mycena sanguinolenta]|uniref:Brix domain-containing protein n=1 Tax=Mycena sanguinolenta TaxID=230812 RepID=A0A8H7D1H7_9AGAR|nr:Brix domain-containing protein [Mycena sanguinolenta]